MKSLQFYKYTTWGLLGLNLLVLAFFMIRQPPFHGGMRAMDTLNLDDKQHTEFLASAQKHKQLITEIKLKQKEILHTYFNQLVTSSAQVKEANVLTTYEQLESQKIKVTYQHFKEIKDFLRADQYADFEKFMTRMLKRILPQSEKRLHHPKDS